ncbi:hypothetical protein BDF14DRAFT_1743338 [Spinellus fusiger]|nr:hypothetical protein BDF14DRAFT_1743338 [Spinellus fusiger]
MSLRRINSQSLSLFITSLLTESSLRRPTAILSFKKPQCTYCRYSETRPILSTTSVVNYQNYKPNVIRLFSTTKEPSSLEKPMSLRKRERSASGSIAITQLSQRGDRHDALRVYMELLSKQQLPSREAIYQLTRAFFHARDIDELQLNSNTVLYNILLKVFLNKGDYANMQMMFQNLLDKKMKPNLHTYSMMLQSAVQQRHYEKVLELLDDMEGYDLIPDRAILSIVINAMCKVRQFDGANNLIHKAFLTMNGNNMGVKFRDLLLKKIR